MAFTLAQKSGPVDNRRNYYRILHVQPDAPDEIIKSSYRTLMQRLKRHPDLGGDHWNAALINEAYRVLMNPASRERYDHERQLIFRESSIGPADKPENDPVDETQNSPAADTAPATDPDPDPACRFCLSPHDRSDLDDPDAVCPNCASPLHPASEWRLEHKGQRAINRIPACLTIEYYTTWPQHDACVGRTLDVSPNGMRFMSNRRLGEGRRVKIDSDIINAIALVSHCQRDGDTSRWIVGVAFETLRLKRSQGAFFSAEA